MGWGEERLSGTITAVAAVHYSLLAHQNLIHFYNSDVPDCCQNVPVSWMYTTLYNCRFVFFAIYIYMYGQIDDRIIQVL